MRSSASSPSRFVRTLPWLAGLLIGASAHIVWWTGQRDSCAEPAAPELTVHVHSSPRAPVVRHVATGTARPAATADALTPALGARGAVVCRQGHCTIRRSFVRRMLRDPALVGTGTRLVPQLDGERLTGLKVFGTYPGGLADLLGLVDGDTITAIDGEPLGSIDELLTRVRGLVDADRFTVTLQHADMVRTMRYRFVDG